MYVSGIEELYDLVGWPSSPFSTEGRRRLFESVEAMKRVRDHPLLIEALKDREHVDILDVMCGGGFGGLALAKLLSSQGYAVSILFTDIRIHPLRQAVDYADKGLYVADGVALPVEQGYLFRERAFDIATLWGLSMVHLDPWAALRLITAISHTLRDRGALLIEEADRVLAMYMCRGYEYVSVERVQGSDRATISIHESYNVVRGAVKRLFIDLIKGKRIAIEMNPFWSIANIGVLLWILFEDVDIVPLSVGTTNRFVLIASRPRRKIGIKDLERMPSILSRELII